jgi:hypothetical protein
LGGGAVIGQKPVDTTSGLFVDFSCRHQLFVSDPSAIDVQTNVAANSGAENSWACAERKKQRSWIWTSIADNRVFWTQTTVSISVFFGQNFSNLWPLARESPVLIR